jgi:hypothetical protein
MRCLGKPLAWGLLMEQRTGMGVHGGRNPKRGRIMKPGVLKAGLIGAAMLLGACSSGGDGGGTTPVASVPLPTGTLIDAPVAGVSYTTSSGLSGTTNGQGQFNYRPGDTVTFAIGGMTLGSVPATPRVTPLNLLGTATFSDPRVVNLSQLLLTLDTNPDPNLISLPSQLPNLQGLDLTSPTFDTEAAAIVGGPLVLEGTATAHLQQQLAALGSDAWGGWVLFDPTETLQIMFIFPDGNYMSSNWYFGPPSPLVTSGIERGVLDWNPGTGVLSSSRTVDTDLTYGLSGVPGPITVAIVGDNMTVTAPNDPSGPYFLTRVPSSANPIHGAWYAYETNEPGSPPISIAFLADGTYMLSEDGSSANGQPGMERGQYEWNETTTCFRTTVQVDTNGEHGLSHIQNKNTSLAPPCSEIVTVSGDTLTYTSAAEGTFTFTRLRKP